MSERLALAGRIRASLEDVQAAMDRAIMLAEKGHRTGDDDYWDGVAYQPVTPNNCGNGEFASGSHRSQDPACLDEYRGFRQIVRNVYAFNLRPARLDELVKDAPECVASLSADLLAFAELLEKTA